MVIPYVELEVQGAGAGDADEVRGEEDGDLLVVAQQGRPRRRLPALLAVAAAAGPPLAALVPAVEECREGGQQREVQQQHAERELLGGKQAGAVLQQGLLARGQRGARDPLEVDAPPVREDAREVERAVEIGAPVRQQEGDADRRRDGAAEEDAREGAEEAEVGEEEAGQRWDEEGDVHLDREGGGEEGAAGAPMAVGEQEDGGVQEQHAHAVVEETEDVDGVDALGEAEQAQEHWVEAAGGGARVDGEDQRLGGGRRGVSGVCVSVSACVCVCLCV